MTRTTRTLFGTAIGAALLAFSAGGAAASIVCSGDVCWHVKERYTYPPAAGVIVHEDSWKAGPSIRFREHEGRGYWKGEVWTDF